MDILLFCLCFVNIAWICTSARIVAANRLFSSKNQTHFPVRTQHQAKTLPFRKMCSLMSDLNVDLQYLCRTVFGTDTDILTVFTLIIIYNRKIIYYPDTAVRADPLTFFAAKAAICTGFSGLYAFIIIAAGNKHLGSIGHKLDNLIWTSLYTESAADTKLSVYSCNTVDNAYRFLGTDCNTVSVAQAAVYAASFAAVEKL